MYPATERSASAGCKRGRSAARRPAGCLAPRSTARRTGPPGRCLRAAPRPDASADRTRSRSAAARAPGKRVRRWRRGPPEQPAFLDFRLSAGIFGLQLSRGREPVQQLRTPLQIDVYGLRQRAASLQLPGRAVRQLTGFELDLDIASL